MKKVVSLLLCAVMLVCAAPVALAEGEGAFVRDSFAPAAFDGEYVVIDKAVSAAEALSFFKNKSSLSALGADGSPLSLTDEVTGGERLVSGESEMRLVLRGDANADGKQNARDVIAMMLAIIGGGELCVAADLNADGSTNAIDVVTEMKRLVGLDVAVASERNAAENDDASLGMFFDEAMHQIAITDTAVYGDAEGLMFLARRERENVQIVLTSTEAKQGLSLEIGALENAEGASLATELRYGYYFDMLKWNQLNPCDLSNYTGGYYVDALPEYEDGFAIGANESKAFYLTAISEPDTAPGWYAASVRVLDGEGREIKRSTVRAYVWDFVLDETPASATAFGLSKGSITHKKCQGDYTWLNEQPNAGELITQWYKEYYDLLLDNHISAYGLPYSITDPRADEYMSDPRVTSFIFGSGSGNGGQYHTDDEQLLANYNKLKTNPEWLDKAYFYDVDEPCGGGYDMVRAQWIRLCLLMPKKDFNVVVPWAQNEYISKGTYSATENTDSVEYCRGYLNIWCPQSYAWGIHHSNEERRRLKDNNLYKPREYKEKWINSNIFAATGEKQWAERYADLRADGNKMWWYICESPEVPYANFFESYQGVSVRVVLWQQYLFDSDGLLYWATAEWSGVNKKKTHGDGTILYWGELFGQTAPVPSTRLVEICDGIEDFQYMTQLERLAGRDAALAFVNRVTTAILDWNEDYTNMRDVRNDMGFELEARYAD